MGTGFTFIGRQKRIRVGDSWYRLDLLLYHRKLRCLVIVDLKRGKFSRSEITEAIDTAKREEGDCRTLWQLVQGLTAYARGYDYVDARVDLETRAGKLLDSIES